MKAKKNLKSEDDAFYQALALLENAEEARLFFEDLCTPNELQAMVDRFQVVPDLIEGKSYRAIHAETGISVTTIGRVARCLNLGRGGYQMLIERLKDIKN